MSKEKIMTKLTKEQRQELIQTANRVRANAYAPYSNYPVGAALLTSSGKIFTGVNVENAVYPLTMCAERSAVFSAVAAGEQKFTAIAVATDNGGTPCGSCRQVLSEFGLDIKVLIVDGNENVIQTTTVGELLPGAFSGVDLPE
ncbi:MAG: cytidine deaminase [Chloroflexota bacterium]|nr:cytidine deaminase [Chloroflexota bacterium]